MENERKEASKNILEWKNKGWHFETFSRYFPRSTVKRKLDAIDKRANFFSYVFENSAIRN